MTRISAQAEQQLRDTVRKVNVLWSRYGQGGEKPMVFPGEQVLAVVSTGGLTAASWPTAGTGNVKLYEYNEDTTNFEVISDPQGADLEVSVLNWVEETLAADDHVVVTKVNDSKGQGVFIVTSKDC